VGDADEAALREAYAQQIASTANKYKRYPNEAMQNNWEGTSTVRLRIGTDGKVAAVSTANSAGHEILDTEARVTINKAKPFVQIPPGLRGKEFEVTVRVVFGLKQ
jgi:periplasmic protein TonB